MSSAQHGKVKCPAILKDPSTKKAVRGLEKKEWILAQRQPWQDHPLEMIEITFDMCMES